MTHGSSPDRRPALDSAPSQPSHHGDRSPDAPGGSRSSTKPTRSIVPAVGPATTRPQDADLPPIVSGLGPSRDDGRHHDILDNEPRGRVSDLDGDHGSHHDVPEPDNGAYTWREPPLVDGPWGHLTDRERDEWRDRAHTIYNNWRDYWDSGGSNQNKYHQAQQQWDTIIRDAADVIARDITERHYRAGYVDNLIDWINELHRTKTMVESTGEHAVDFWTRLRGFLTEAAGEVGVEAFLQAGFGGLLLPPASLIQAILAAITILKAVKGG